MAYWRKERKLSACSKASKATAVQCDARRLAEASLARPQRPLKRFWIYLHFAL